MAVTLRFTKDEQNKLRDKCIEFNKILITNELVPLRDSELAHQLLQKALGNARITKKGEILIDD